MSSRRRDAAKLPGHRWRVVAGGGVPLRVPKAGTLDDLIRKHAAFLGRLSNERIQARAAAELLRYRQLSFADRGSVGNAASPARRLRDSPHHRGPGEGRELWQEQVPPVPSRPARGDRRRHGTQRHRHRRRAHRLDGGRRSEAASRGTATGTDGQATTVDRSASCRCRASPPTASAASAGCWSSVRRGSTSPRSAGDSTERS